MPRRETSLPFSTQCWKRRCAFVTRRSVGWVHIAPGRESMVGRVALEGRVVHVADILADPDFALPETVAAGRRTILGVPLLRDSEPIGIITLNRPRRAPSPQPQY